jgi:hypothetical protein
MSELTKKQMREMFLKKRDENVSLSAEEYLIKKNEYIQNFWKYDSDESALLYAKIIDDDWESVSEEERKKYFDIKKDNEKKQESKK